MDIEQRIARILRDLGVSEVETSRYSTVGCSAERAAAGLVAALGLEREEMALPTGPEYLVRSQFGGEGEMAWAGQTVTKNPDFRYVRSERYITDWEPMASPE